MPIYKYTVANKEGKKLNGNVEAPDEQTARHELTNLGFSIISLAEVERMEEAPPTEGTKFIFEAIDKNSQLINGTIPAKTKDSALGRLSTEYELTVTAIWEEGADEATIEAARKEGSATLQKEIKPKTTEEQQGKEETAEEQAETKIKTAEQIKEEEFTKRKIEHILGEVHELLQKFDQDIDKDQKSEINKRIDKLLRIKNSTNVEYILETAEDLLNFIRSQERSLKEKGLKEKQLELKIETSSLIGELKKSPKSVSLSEDIIKKITDWQKKHVKDPTKESAFSKTINSTLNYIRKKFETPKEILAKREEIKVYNKQLWDFTKMYFKEPTPEYKAKVKKSLKTVWEARKKAKTELKELQKGPGKEKAEKEKKEEEVKSIILPFLKELNAFSGWLLTFYIAYYFAAIYLGSKDFGFSSIPKGFVIYESQIFKYVLAILFLFHISVAVKINYLKKSKIADIVLPIMFIFGSIITLLNF